MCVCVGYRRIKAAAVSEVTWMTIGRQIMDVAHGVPASMVGGLLTPEAAARQAEAQVLSDRLRRSE